MELTSHQYSSVLIQNAVTLGLPIATSLAFLNSCLNPLLYVFMGQDFKDKVCKSIVKVLENAFQEEETQADSKTVETTQGNENSQLWLSLKQHTKQRGNITMEIIATNWYIPVLILLSVFLVWVSMFLNRMSVSEYIVPACCVKTPQPIQLYIWHLGFHQKYKRGMWYKTCETDLAFMAAQQWYTSI